MKTHTKISTLAVVYALCAGVAMPTFAAPSVRALGGAGTYSSASSATQAKTGTASTAQKAETVRGGSLSVDSGTSSAGAKTVTNKVSGTATGIRGSSARSASVRVPSSARLSIGKYLGGASVSTPPKQCIPGEPGCDTPTPSEDFIEYQISYDEDTYRLTIYDKTNREEVMSRDVASHKALENLREDLTELEGLVGSGELDTEAVTIIAAINELVAGKQDKLTAGDGIAIDGDMITANIGDGLKFENGKIVTDIEFPDAPIQKEIKAGNGIDVARGTDSDIVKVKLAAGGGLEFAADGSLRTSIEIPEVKLKEYVEGAGIIVEDIVGKDKATVKVKLAADGGLTTDPDGSLRTSIKIPEVELKEYVEGDGITVEDIAGEDKATVKVKLAADGGLKFDSDGSLRTAIDLPNVPVQEKLNAGTGIKIDGNTISTNFEVEQNSKTYLDIKEENGKQIFILSHLPDPDGNFIYKSGQGVSVGAENALNLNLRAANGTIILEDQDDGTVLIKANIPENMPPEVQKALTAGVAVSADALADGQISFMYDGKSGLRINENNQVAVSLGSGLKFNESTGAIETIATLPESGEVQAKLTAGKYINIDENNVITTTLKESDSIKISEDGTITASVPLKEYTGGNGIDVAADGTITTKLLSSNSEQLNINYDESGNAVFTLNVPGLDGNTQYTAGAGLNLDGNEFRLSATESGMFLYTYNADTKQGSWQQVEIVDETDVNTSSEATN
ncbi:MAG: hypothetical protein R8N24_00710 [Alphaproteobacteria bacterium]|nr:hypothetical protein [Alphaproteobacteria bacterium]